MRDKRIELPPMVMRNMDRLRVERVSQGMTRELLSERSGIAAKTLTQYENSGTPPSRRNYNKLAEIFSWEEWQ